MIMILQLFLLAATAGVLGYLIYICFLISKVSLTVPFPSILHEPSPLEEEKVEFRALDGALLEGRWIAAKGKSSKVIVFCHELGADLNSWHKYGAYLPESGFNVFTFNFRKLPERRDGVHQFTTGQWVTTADRADVLAAIHFLEKRFAGSAEQMGILGISKGANAALSVLGEARRVKAVITDGAFSTAETVLDYVKKWVSIFVPIPWIYRNTPEWFYRLLVKISLIISGLKLRCRFVGIEKSLHTATAPVLFIHGEKDEYITPRQAQYLFDAARSREGLWIVPKARHNDAVQVAPEEYREKIVSFFNENL
jgi:pimeloyl-ACP methyl ester carboxylesterase